MDKNKIINTILINGDKIIRAVCTIIIIIAIIFGTLIVRTTQEISEIEAKKIERSLNKP